MKEKKTRGRFKQYLYDPDQLKENVQENYVLKHEYVFGHQIKQKYLKMITRHTLTSHLKKKNKMKTK